MQTYIYIYMYVHTCTTSVYNVYNETVIHTLHNYIYIIYIIYIYIYIYIHNCIHIYYICTLHTYTHTYIYIYIHNCIHYILYLHILYIHMLYIHTVYVYKYICIYTHICININIYIYMSMHIENITWNQKNIKNCCSTPAFDKPIRGSLSLSDFSVSEWWHGVSRRVERGMDHPFIHQFVILRATMPSLSFPFPSIAIYFT